MAYWWLIGAAISAAQQMQQNSAATGQTGQTSSGKVWNTASEIAKNKNKIGL